jgi:8-oxo-dGTP diphosphatase
VSIFHLVAYAVLLRGDRLLVARRSGVSYADGCWGLPGGHVEPGETLAVAAAREAEEEVGVGIEPADLEPIGMFRYVEDGVDGLDVFFRAGRWTGEPRPVQDCDDVAWCRPDTLPEPAVPWLAAALEHHLLRGRWFSEFVG